MSDDLTARIDEVLDRHDHEQRRNNVTVEILQPGHPMLRLLAEARDEITRLRAERDDERRTMDEVFDNQQAEIARLRAGVEAHLEAVDPDMGTCDYKAEDRLRALLDAPSTGEDDRG